ncbi:MAG: tRNA (guanosine(37)-N1)-methyltransferase TrmD, partial [Gammaproteobacteria bacterium]
ELYIHDLRPFTSSKQKSIDDYAYGGGAGMVMMIEPIDRCISALKKHTDYDEIIFMTPDGEKLSQSTCNQLSLNKNIILLCGHYKGIDQRVRDHLITREISIGDYVLSGGEIAAMVVADSLIRLIPGVLNDESSALTDSFQDDLLAPPVYTRPAVYNGWEVPKVLLSGNEAVINDWRHEAAVKKTKERRPRLLN